MLDHKENDIYEQTPSKAINDFTSVLKKEFSEMKTPNKKLSSGFKSSIKRCSIRDEEKKTTSFNLENEDDNSGSKRKKSEHSRSQVPNQSSRSLEDHRMYLIIKYLGALRK
jgi:hypothetical protein